MRIDAHVMSIVEGKRKNSGRNAVAAAVVMSGLIGLTGCGERDAAADLPTAVEIVGDDYSFSGVPDEIAAGAAITLRNDSDTELHEIVAIRLPDDEERSAAEILQLPPEEAETVLGMPSAVILAPVGGGNINAIGSGSLDGAGRYIFFCSIPVGADEAEYLEAAATSETAPEVDGGPPHFVEGMWAEVTVVER